MLEFHQLRDCQAWKDDNLELSTTSNEAAKLFDLAVHQYVGWYEDEKVGGVKGVLTKLEELDPNFVMPKVYGYGLEILGTCQTIRKNKELAKNLEDLEQQAKNMKLPEHERLHVKALRQWADGHMFNATLTWERILVEHPKDALALKFANDTYFYLGKSQLIRDSVASVLSAYKPSSSYYGYVKGMYAFGLEETNLYRQAKEYALQALNVNKQDAWAAHALIHSYEMQGLIKEGKHFLSKNNDDWVVCGFLATHMYWHWCLMLIEEGRYDEVLELYDNIIHQRACSNQTMLDIVDVSSLLYRLELEGVNVGDRWNDIFELCQPHMDDHILIFNDAHILMSICGMKKPELAQQHLNSLQEHMNSNDDDQVKITRNVGMHAYEAVSAYSAGDYDKVVDLLYPVRTEVVGIGGSHAQRDVFNQILIQAALKSKNPFNWKLARSLLYERKAQKPNSPLTDRLLSNLMACHVISENHS